MNTLLNPATTTTFQKPVVATTAPVSQPAGTNWVPWLVGGAAVGAVAWWLLRRS